MITHNLRTVLVGADGKIVRIYSGNEWTHRHRARRPPGRRGGSPAVTAPRRDRTSRRLSGA